MKVHEAGLVVMVVCPSRQWLCEEDEKGVKLEVKSPKLKNDEREDSRVKLEKREAGEYVQRC